MIKSISQCENLFEYIDTGTLPPGRLKIGKSLGDLVKKYIDNGGPLQFSRGSCTYKIVPKTGQMINRYVSSLPIKRKADQQSRFEQKVSMEQLTRKVNKTSDRYEVPKIIKEIFPDSSKLSVSKFNKKLGNVISEEKYNDYKSRSNWLIDFKGNISLVLRTGPHDALILCKEKESMILKTIAGGWPQYNQFISTRSILKVAQEEALFL
jgi:hypothetical protein